MRSLLALLMVVLAATAAAPQARAQGLTDWQRDVRDWLGGLPGKTSMAQCLARLKAPAAVGTPTLTFIGIPEDESRLGRGTRNDLNDMIVAAFPPGLYSVRRGEAYRSMIESILPRRGQPDAAANALRDFYGSDMFLTAEAERRTPEIVRLRLNLSILDPETGEICVSETLPQPVAIDIRTLQSTQDAGSVAGGREFHDLDGALQAITVDTMQRLQERQLVSGQPLSYRVRSGLDGKGCAVASQIERAFQSAYTLVGEKGAINRAIGAAAWPPLRRLPPVTTGEEAPPIEGPHLSIEIGQVGANGEAAPDAADSAVLSLVASAQDGDAAIATYAYDVVVPRNLLRGCEEAKPALTLDRIFTTAKSEPAYPVTLTPLHDPFIPGRHDLEIDIAVGDALYLYCWLLADDGMGYVFFPNEAGQLRGPFRPGSRLRFPADFFNRSVALPISQPGRSLFGCFSSRSPVAEDLKNRWLEGFAANSLDKDAIQDFLDTFRALDTVGETYAWIDHGGKAEP